MRVIAILKARLGSHEKVFIHVFIHVSFVGMCIVVIQDTKENLIQEKHQSMAVHKDLGSLNIPST